MSKGKPAKAPHYYLFIEANGVSETVKASPIKHTAIALAETYLSKHRSHNVSVKMETQDPKTGAIQLVEVWTSKGRILPPKPGLGFGRR
jgi:hypothetical protein